MKRLILCVLTLAVVSFLGMGISQAAQSVNVSGKAIVPSLSPTVSVTILKFIDGNPDNNPWTGSTQVTSMDFDALTHLFNDNSEAGLWYSKAGFCIVIYAQAYGKPYDIKSSCAGVTSGTNSLPSGSFGLTPVYSAEDKWVWSGGEKKQGPMPAGASLGSAGTAVATDKTIYSSEPGTGTARILQAYYGLSPYKAGGAEPFPGYTPIPLNQAPGTYTATVTITIVTK